MLLRVPPFRGAQVAAGVVVLTTLAALLQLRMEDWPDGTHLACSAALGAFVWALVIETPPAEGLARPWLAALCLSALVLLGLSLARIVALSGERDAGIAVSLALVCAAAAWCARRRGAASCALVAGVTGAATPVAAALWLGDPSVTTIRWLLALAAFVLLVLTLATRDHRPEHGAQLACAGGTAVAAIGLAGHVLHSGGVGTGWELLILAAGFGLMAYGAVDGHRGPVVAGLANTAIFVEIASTSGDLVGWPIALLAAGLALLAIGLRPTTPAPPEPGADAEPPPAIEVRVDR